MRAWVYKVNSKVGGWHFDRYFRYRGRQPYDMGGPEWIRSPLSWAHLRRVRRGDLFVCYQADERRIYGLARAASPGYKSLPRHRRDLPALSRVEAKGLSRAMPRSSGLFDSVDFEPGGLRLDNPVSVQHPAARQLFRHIRAFTVPSRGTVHPVAQDELRALLRQLIAFNPNQRDDIFRFASPRRGSS